VAKSKEYLSEISGILKAHRAWSQDSRYGHRANLQNYDLSDMRLCNIDLRRANLTGANLSGTDLTEANLSGASLIAADLDRADLTRANLYGADLRGASLNEANLDSANLMGADFRANLDEEDTGEHAMGEHPGTTHMVDACLRRTVLIETQMQGVNMTGAEMEDADLSGADLSGAIVVGANISDAVIGKSANATTSLDDLIVDAATAQKLRDRGLEVEVSELDVRGALNDLVKKHQKWIESDGYLGERLALDFCLLDGADLSGQDLRGASFVRCSLKGTNFAGARLSLSTFNHSTMTDVSFRGADLSGCTFKRDDLSRGDFADTIMAEVELNGAGKVWPTSFRRCTLDRAVLNAKQAAGLLFQSVDLSTAKLNLVVLRHAQFHGTTLPKGVSEAKLRELRRQCA
jgi:uncharacterized protein YjbI with pentapeptide repeats